MGTRTVYIQTCDNPGCGKDLPTTKDGSVDKTKIVVITRETIETNGHNGDQYDVQHRRAICFNCADKLLPLALLKVS